MSSQEESIRVSKIYQILENDIQGDIYSQGKKIGRVYVIRRGFGSERGRPDVITWIELNMEVLGVLTKTKIPILIEDEKGGMQAAKEDYKAFFERDKIALSMLVIGGERRFSKQENIQAKGRLHIEQIPFNRIISHESSQPGERP